MKSLKSSITVFVLFAAFSIVACSQKEDKKTKATPAVMGRAADTTTTAVADAIAGRAEEISVQSISKTGSEVQTEILIGGTRKTLVFRHDMSTYSSSRLQEMIGNIEITGYSYCADPGCNYYYVMIEPRRNSTLLYQVAVLKDFAHSGKDLYKMQPGTAPLSFDQMIEDLADAYIF